jgi:excinuclease ABC subunit C
VGKATNLATRVRSYFRAPGSMPSRVRRLISRVDAVEFVVAGSEQEALILECDMIKRYRPRYNVRLKDDKSFPYLKVSTNEPWPGVYITRRKQVDGARYFGPSASAGSLRKTLNIAKRIFPVRSCTRKITGTDERPCLDYYIHRCLGPCIGAVSNEKYREVIHQLVLFLEGKPELVLRGLKRNMKVAVQRLDFEKAALLRDQIRAIENVMEGQKIAVALKGEQDVIAMAQSGEQAYVEVFFVRNSRLIGRDHFVLEGISDERPSQALTNFVKQFYASASYIPSAIWLQHSVDESPALSEWLTSLRGGGVSLEIPRRGAKRHLMDMVAGNAEAGLRLFGTTQMNSEAIASGLRELQAKLRLPETPMRIEAYDISNIRGALAVGGAAVFERGLPKPAHYRHFRIEAVRCADDYAMMQDMLRRRFKRGVSGEGSWALMPDLILIDGGRGHLNAALEVTRELRLDSIPVASLAKENEEVFVPGQPEPIVMSASSSALHILQRARDEAHRFAVSYHRKLRLKRGTASPLDVVPGIGPKRKTALLRKFGSLRGIKDASEEELSQVAGVTLVLAQRLKRHL